MQPAMTYSKRKRLNRLARVLEKLKEKRVSLMDACNWIKKKIIIYKCIQYCILCDRNAETRAFDCCRCVASRVYIILYLVNYSVLSAIKYVLYLHIRIIAGAHAGRS